VKTGPHQAFWNHSHCTPDNTANIKQDMTYCLSRVNAVLRGNIPCLKQTLLHQRVCITLPILHIFSYKYTPLLQKQFPLILRCTLLPLSPPSVLIRYPFPLFLQFQK
jgi:hypothetical protein